jgi:hypothetical protein
MNIKDNKKAIAEALEENDQKRRKQQAKDVGNAFLGLFILFLLCCFFAWLLM